MQQTHDLKVGDHIIVDQPPFRYFGQVTHISNYSIRVRWRSDSFSEYTKESLPEELIKICKPAKNQ